MSSFIPNSFQVPNVYSDRILPMLTEAEARCLIYMCRRTYGFGKNQARIALSQFVSGTRAADGAYLDYGTGLSKNAVIAALGRLQEMGIIVRLDDGDKSAHVAAEWGLITDENLIKMSDLRTRKSDRKRRNHGRANHLNRCSADEPRPGSADEPRPGSADEPRPGSADEPRPGSADEPRPGSADEPLFKEKTSKRKPEEKTRRENQSDQESSSSSDLLSDQGPQSRDDDDDDFDFLMREFCRQFGVTRTEAIADAIRDWMADNSRTKIEAAITRGGLYTPKAPLVYVKGILDAEGRPQRGERAEHTRLGAEWAGLVIGV